MNEREEKKIKEENAESRKQNAESGMQKAEKSLESADRLPPSDFRIRASDSICGLKSKPRILTLFGILLALSITFIVSEGAAVQQWVFTTASNFSYDSGKVTLAGSKAKLRNDTPTLVVNNGGASLAAGVTPVNQTSLVRYFTMNSNGGHTRYADTYANHQIVCSCDAASTWTYASATTTNIDYFRASAPQFGCNNTDLTRAGGDPSNYGYQGLPPTVVDNTYNMIHAIRNAWNGVDPANTTTYNYGAYLATFQGSLNLLPMFTYNYVSPPGISPRHWAQCRTAGSILNPGTGNFTILIQGLSPDGNWYLRSMTALDVNGAIRITRLSSGEYQAILGSLTLTTSSGGAYAYSGIGSLALVRSGTGTNNVTLYIDGTAAVQGTNNENPNSNNDYIFGANNVLSNPWSGSIGPISTWNRALTVQEMATVFAYGINFPQSLSVGSFSTGSTTNYVSGLVSWWPLDEANPIMYETGSPWWVCTASSCPTAGAPTIISDAVGGRNSTSMTAFGNSSWTLLDHNAGGWALKFNGTTNTITVPALEAAAGINNQVSFAAWIKRGGTIPSASNQYLIGATGSNGWGVFIPASTNRLAFEKTGSTSISSTGSNLLMDITNWYHVAVTYSGTTACFYVNGTLDSCGSFVQSINTSASNYTIGSRGAATYFNGQMDDVAVYNRALTPFEVQLLAQGSPVAPVSSINSSISAPKWAIMRPTMTGYLPDPLERQPMAYWKMDSGSNAADASGSGNTGAFEGTSFWDTDVPATVFMKDDPASLGFNGTDFRVRVPDAQVFNSSVFSIATWVKTTSSSRSIVSKGATGAGGYELSVGASAPVFKKFTSGADLTLNGSTAINDGNWHHVAAVADISGMFLYVDGKLDASNGSAGGTTSSAPFYLGYSPAGYLRGSLNETAFYDYALNRTEIARLGRGQKRPHTADSGLVALWHLDNDGLDSAGSNHGTTLSNVYVPGVFGTARQSSLSIPDSTAWSNATLNPAASILTVEAWINTATKSQTILNKSGTYLLGLDANGYLYFTKNGSITATGSINIADGNWHHIAGMADNSGMLLYIDGIPDTPTPQSNGTPFTATPGTALIINASTTLAVDEVALRSTSSSGQRGGAQVRYQAQTSANGSAWNSPWSGGGTPNRGPAGVWHLNDGTSQTVTDGSVNILDGTLGADTNILGDDPASTSSGKIGNALVFNGSSQVVNIPDPNAKLNPNGNLLTLSAWINTNASSKAIFSKSSNGTDGYELSINASGQVYCRTAGGTYTASNFAVNDSNWHHVAAVSGAGGVSIYVDGLPAYTTATPTSITAPPANTPLTIGKKSSGSFFSGSIDDVSVWNTDLSGPEIWDLYEAGHYISRTDGDFLEGLNKEQYMRYHANFIAVNVMMGTGYSNLGVMTSGKYPTTDPTIQPASGNSFNYAKNLVITENKPAGSDLRYIFSPNGSAATPNWYYWNGSAWAASTSYAQSATWTSMNTIFNGKMPIERFDEEVRTLLPSLPSNQPWTFLWKAFLHSNDGSVTPDITDVSVDLYEGTLSMQTPAGGEIWPVTTVRKISWQNTGAVPDDLTLEYTTNGTTYTTIDTGIQNNHNEEKMPGIQGIWHFDGGTSGAIADASTPVGLKDAKNNFQGTARSSALNWGAGRFNGAVQFDGTLGYVEVADNAALDPARGATPKILTLSAWIKTATSNRAILYKGSGNNGYELSLDGTGKLVFKKFTGSSTVSAVSAAAVDNNQWRHVAGVSDGKTLTLYIDGVKNGTPTADTSDFAVTTGDPLTIGKSTVTGSNFNGFIDDTAIFNTALTAPAVAALASSTTYSYYWNIPSNATLSTTVNVQIRSVDAPAIRVSSNTFRLSAAFFITSPNGGGSPLVSGTTTNITWSNQGTAVGTTALLEYTADGSVYNTISGAGCTTNSGSCSWTVPNVRSTQAKVKVSIPGSNPLLSDESDDPFSILVFKLDSPNGGESLVIGSQAGISWTATSGVPNDLILDYSIDGVFAPTPIATGLTAAGVYLGNVNTNPTAISNAVGVWRLDGSESDISGNSNTALLSGAGVTYAAGKFGSAADFAGNQDFLRINSVGAYDSASSTWSFWFKTSATSGMIASRRDAGDISGLGLSLNNCTTLKTQIINSSSQSVVSYTNPISCNAWNHVAVTFSTANGAAATTYINGGSSSTANNAFAWNSSGQQIRLGKPLSGLQNGFAGQIDEFAVYSRALEDYEAKRLAGGFGYLWSIPDTFPHSSKVKVRVRSSSESAMTDTSDANFKAVTPTATVTITNPTASSVISFGTNFNITWTNDSDVEGTFSNDVKIEYLKDAQSSWQTIQNGALPGGSCSTVGTVKTCSFAYSFATTATSSTMKIRITDNVAPNGSATTAPFKVVGFFNVNKPDGGEKWAAGVLHDIQWVANGGMTNVKIFAYDTDPNDPAMVIPIVDSTAAGVGYFSWTPSALNAKAGLKIRVQDANDPSVYDDSDATFSVTDVAITGLASRMLAGDLQTINWTNDGFDPNPANRAVKIEYSLLGDFSDTVVLNNGDPIATGAASGSFNMTLPVKTVRTFKIRVTDAVMPPAGTDQTLASSTSSDTTLYGNMTVLAPSDTNVTWTSSQLQDITWTTFPANINVVPNVKIVAAVNGNFNDAAAGNLVTITDSAPNHNNPGAGTGKFSWLPSFTTTLGPTAKIRVMDADDPSPQSGQDQDDSNNAFEIIGLAISSPLGGTQTAIVGQSFTTTFSFSAGISQVDIQYSPNNGTNWTNILLNYNVPSNPHTYTWTNVPDDITAQGKIRVQKTGDPTAFAVSGVFGIKSNLSITTPPLLIVSDTYGIQWTNVGTVTDIKIEFSSSGLFNGDETTVATLTGQTGTSHTTNWTVPSDITTTGKLRITDQTVRANGTPASSATTGAFSIGPKFAFTAPVSSTEWVVAQTGNNIAWTTAAPAGSVPTVAIDYFVETDNYTAPYTVTAGATNNGIFSWNPIPDLVTLNGLNPQVDRDILVKVRVRDITPGHPVVSVTSQIFKVRWLTVTWRVRDNDSLALLQALNVVDSTSWIVDDYTLNQLTGAARNYKFGNVTTSWSKLKYQPQTFDWVATQDENREVLLLSDDAVNTQNTVRVEYTYNKTTNNFSFRWWLEIRGILQNDLTKLGTGRIDIYSNGSSVLLDSVNATFADDNGVYTANYSNTPGKLVSGNIYFAKATIVFQTKTLVSGVTIDFSQQSQLQAITESNTQLIAANAQLTSAIGSIADTNLSNTVFGKVQALKDLMGQATDPSTADTVFGKVASAEASSTKILGEVQTTLPDLIKKNSGGSKGGRGRMLARDPNVEIGDTAAIRFQHDSGLVPTVDVYDSNNGLIVNDAIMKEIGTSGIYNYDFKVANGSKKGEYTVIVNEASSGFMDSQLLNVIGAGSGQDAIGAAATSAQASASSASAETKKVYEQVAGIKELLGGGDEGLGFASQLSDIVLAMATVRKTLAALTGADESGGGSGGGGQPVTITSIHDAVLNVAKELKSVASEEGVNLDVVYESISSQEQTAKAIQNMVSATEAAAKATKDILEKAQEEPVMTTWFETVV